MTIRCYTQVVRDYLHEFPDVKQRKGYGPFYYFHSIHAYVSSPTNGTISQFPSACYMRCLFPWLRFDPYSNNYRRSPLSIFHQPSVPSPLWAANVGPGPILSARHRQMWNEERLWLTFQLQLRSLSESLSLLSFKSLRIPLNVDLRDNWAPKLCKSAVEKRQVDYVFFDYRDISVRLRL